MTDETRPGDDPSQVGPTAPGDRGDDTTPAPDPTSATGGAPSTDDPPSHRVRRGLRRELLLALELSALVGFAVTQPVLGPFGDAPEVFVSAGASRAQVIAFGVGVALVPVLVLAVAAALTRLAGDRARAVTQTVLVAVLAGVWAMDVARASGLVRWALVAVGAIAAVAMALARRRWAPARQWLRYAAPSPLVFLAVFLFLAPSSSLVRTSDPAAPAATAPTTGDEPPPVVVIVFDELPTLSIVDGQGGIDRDLVPNLARLADTSTWYRDATTVAPATGLALPAITTGTTPSAVFGPPAVHEAYPDNLFTLLAPTHELHVTEWVTELCPRSLCPPSEVEVDDAALRLVSDAADPTAPAHPLATLVDDAAEVWWQRIWPFTDVTPPDLTVPGLEQVGDHVRPGLEFVSGIEPAEGPVLDYLHAPVPHQPWDLLPSGQHYDGPNPPRGAGFQGWGDDDTSALLAEVGRARHLLQVQWADRLLGEVIDRLEAVGRWDDALVVFTADHGVSFTEGQLMRSLTPESELEVAWVPLLVKEPGQRTGAVVDDNVELIDVLPTIAELAGIDLPFEVEGRSFAEGSTRRPGDKHALSDLPDRYAERDGELVRLEADGLGAIRTAPSAGDAADPLRVWRTGAHGNLVGQPVTELGVCAADEPVTVALDGRRPGDDGVEPGWVPAWLHGTVEGGRSRTVVVAADGVVAGWDQTLRSTRTSDLGVLVAAPLLSTDDPDLALYELVDGPGCRLVPMAVEP